MKAPNAIISIGFLSSSPMIIHLRLLPAMVFLSSISSLCIGCMQVVKALDEPPLSGFEAAAPWLIPDFYSQCLLHMKSTLCSLIALQVMKALNASPLSAPEAAALGLITGPSHRSDATKTLLHSPTSSAHPSSLVASDPTVYTRSAAKQAMIKAAGVSAMLQKSDAQESSAGNSDAGLDLGSAPGSAAQAVHSATHVSDSVALRPDSSDSAPHNSVTQYSPAQGSAAQDLGSADSSVTDTCGTDKAPAVSLGQSSAADAEVPSAIASQPVQLPGNIVIYEKCMPGRLRRLS